MRTVVEKRGAGILIVGGKTDAARCDELKDGLGVVSLIISSLKNR